MKKQMVMSLLGIGLMVGVGKSQLVYASQPFGGGSGTESDPYRLSTPEHLTELQVAVDGRNTFAGKYFILTNDIDFSGYDNDNNPDNGNFNPIGKFTVGYHFGGKLDGQGHKISNLRIHLPEEKAVGLFAYVLNAEITNLKLEAVDIQGKSITGGLTGHLENSLVNQLSISGEVSGEKMIGGLVGQELGSMIENSHTSVTVAGTDSQIGGLVGRVDRNSTVRNCQAIGYVDGVNHAGVLVGWVQDSTIEQSSALGDISGTNYIGGLFGLISNSTIKQSSALGDVSGEKWAGGLIGASYSSTIEQSSALGDVSGEKWAGGLIGTSYSSTIEQSSALGEISGYYSVGGLMGESYGSTINQSLASGEVFGVENVGGLVGWTTGTAINNSFTTSNIIGEGWVGGLVGAVDNSTINNVYAIGNIEGTYHVGGLVGNNWGDSIIKNAYHLGSVTGTTNVGRISGWHEENSVIENVYYNQEENVGLPIIGLDESTVELGQVIGLKEYQMSQTNSKNYMTLLDFENVWVTTSTTPMFRWQTDLMSAKQGDIQINGNIQPMMADVTIPSVSPDLVIDPNSPDGVMSPEFEITNDSTSPIKLELKTFEQTTNTFNDVLPDKYDSWEGLNRKESQDIALGLIAKEGNGWQRLTTPASYVSGHTEHEIGVVKPTSQVNFEFDVHHGRAFSESKMVQYRMVFVFDLLN